MCASKLMRSSQSVGTGRCEPNSPSAITTGSSRRPSAVSSYTWARDRRRQLALDHEALGRQLAHPLGQHVGADARQARAQIREALGPEQQLADDHQRPALAHQVEGARDAAHVPVGALALRRHGVDSTSEFPIMWLEIPTHVVGFSNRCPDQRRTDPRDRPSHRPQALAGALHAVCRRAHDRARRDDRERRAAVHPGRSRLLPEQPRLGRQRLPDPVRRPPAAGRPLR